MCSNIGNSKSVGKAHDLFTLYSQGGENPENPENPPALIITM